MLHVTVTFGAKVTGNGDLSARIWDVLMTSCEIEMENTLEWNDTNHDNW